RRGRAGSEEPRLASRVLAVPKSARPSRARGGADGGDEAGRARDALDRPSSGRGRSSCHLVARAEADLRQPVRDAPAEGPEREDEDREDAPGRLAEPEDRRDARARSDLACPPPGGVSPLPEETFASQPLLAAAHSLVQPD